MGKISLVQRDFVVMFADWLVGEAGRQPKTGVTHLKSLRRGERLTGKAAHKVTPEDVAAIKRMDTPRLSIATKEATIVAYRGLHRWGLEKGYRWANVRMTVVSVPRRKRRVQSSLTTGEARFLMESCVHPLEFRLIFPGLLQGVRVGESAALDRHNFHGDLLRLTVKGGKEIEVPLHPLLAQWKSLVLSSGPVHPETLQNVRKRMTRKTGIVFTPHWLRRTFARHLENVETPEEVIGELMGHARTMTGHYTGGVSEFRMRKALVGLDYFSGEGFRPFMQAEAG